MYLNCVWSRVLWLLFGRSQADFEHYCFVYPVWLNRRGMVAVLVSLRYLRTVASYLFRPKSKLNIVIERTQMGSTISVIMWTISKLMTFFLFKQWINRFPFSHSHFFLFINIYFFLFQNTKPSMKKIQLETITNDCTYAITKYKQQQ